MTMPIEDLPALEKKLYALELELMRPATRSSRATLEELIDGEFVAIASTGTTYDRESAISALLLERPQAWSIGGFRARLLAPGVALTTYVAATSAGPSSHRSSIWKLDGGRWRMTFHQGTAVKD